MLRHVALVRTEVSEEPSASINRVTRIGELGTTLAVIINRCTLRRITMFSARRLIVTADIVPSSPILVILVMQELRSSVSPVRTRATRCNIPEDGIHQEILCWLPEISTDQKHFFC
jgi:hypothetical protein